MSRPGRALVVGESLVDVVTAADGTTLSRSPGGSPMNVATALARLGIPVSLITCVGGDYHGDLIRSHLETSGVHLISVGSARTTSTAVARLRADGAAEYEFDLTWSPGQLSMPEPAGPLGPVTWLHVGSLGAALPPGQADVLRLVEIAVGAEIPVSFDPNFRPALQPDPALAAREAKRFEAAATLVKMSEEDLEYLRPGAQIEDALQDRLAGRTTTVVITRGRFGAIGLDLTGSEKVAAPIVDVVDTVGAGDSFMAALIAGRLLGLTDLRVLLHAAVQAAAKTCARRGADPPWRTDLPSSWPS
jgi:fructokinase